MKFDPVSLSNVCRGVAMDLFERELQRVLQNIDDPNTDPKRARKITLTFDFKPLGDRSAAEVGVSRKATLVAPASERSTLFLQRDGQIYRAIAHDARQEPLFPQEQKPLSVVPAR